jgi:acid phosphatase (class A)
MKLKTLQASIFRPVLLAAIVAANFNTVILARNADELHYLKVGQLDAAELLAPPPIQGSPEQDADMSSVKAVHKACGTNEAAVAISEKKFSVFNFAPAIGQFFQPGKLPKTESFFERLQEEAAVVTDHAKLHWKRPRPYTIDPSLASGKLEKSFSYPSGHSTEATVLALVLADLFPSRRDDVLAVGRGLGWHRVLIARHYPTDIYAGRVLARAIVREMKLNTDFQRDFAEARLEIQAAQATQLKSPGHAALDSVESQPVAK